MKEEEIYSKFNELKFWSSQGNRAPHKPLLALLAIGLCLGGSDRLVAFGPIREKLAELLREFGPFRTVYHPEYPFWRMQHDDDGGIWELDRPHLVTLTSKGDAHASSLLNHGIRGGFPADIHDMFLHSPEIAMRVADTLLRSHFPESLHADILRATGIAGELPNKNESRMAEEPTPEYVASRHLKRDDRFRDAVLVAYENQCAVCNFAVKMGGVPLALEAAHIKWHKALGPAEVRNGLSLCALHHKLFDKGAFTLLSKELKLIVANDLSEEKDPGFQQSLGKFHEKRLQFVPHNIEEHPAPEFLVWHATQVFKSKNPNPGQRKGA